MSAKIDFENALYELEHTIGQEGVSKELVKIS